MGTILTPSKAYSSKYPLDFRCTSPDDNLTLTIVDFSTGGAIFFESTIYPDGVDTGSSEFTYSVDIGPVLDTYYNYLNYDIGEVYYEGVYEEARVLIQDSVITSFVNINVHKARSRFYDYFSILSNVAGYVLPTSYNVTGDHIVYTSKGQSSLLIGYVESYPAPTITVNWTFDDGTTQSEGIGFTVTAGGHFNFGLDELVAQSAVVTPATKGTVASYTVTGGGIINLSVTVDKRCKFDILNLVYPNKSGYWECLTIPSVMRETYNNTKFNYRKNRNNFSTRAQSNGFDSREQLTPVYIANHTISMNVVTDWVQGSQQEQLKAAAGADVLYVTKLIDSSTGPIKRLVPISLLGEEISFKTAPQDKLYNFELELELQPLNS